MGNSVHYLYDTLRPNIGPTAAFTGHVMSSFFIKACFSPDGTHILSGSSDKNAYIWQVHLASRAKPCHYNGHCLLVKPVMQSFHLHVVPSLSICRVDLECICICDPDCGLPELICQEKQVQSLHIFLIQIVQRAVIFSSAAIVKLSCENLCTWGPNSCQIWCTLCGRCRAPAQCHCQTACCYVFQLIKAAL